MSPVALTNWEFDTTQSIMSSLGHCQSSRFSVADLPHRSPTSLFVCEAALVRMWYFSCMLSADETIKKCVR